MLRNRAWCLWIGIVLIIAGGAFLATGGSNIGAPVGTVLGLAGLGLLGWSWFIPRPDEREE